MGRGTILVVDDEEVVSEMISEMLIAVGYTVKIVSSGAAAVTLYKTDSSRINLVVLDILMPGMNGFETYDRLKEINPSIKVIFSSGYSSDEQTHRILRTDKQYFLQKPFTLTELSEVIRKAIEP